jgi:hypothetical protein
VATGGRGAGAGSGGSSTGGAASGGAGTGGAASGGMAGAASGGRAATGGMNSHGGGSGQAGSSGAAGTSTGGRGGTSGNGGAGGAAGVPGSCPTGKIWCPGCAPGEGACYTGGCPGVACPPPDAGSPDATIPSCADVTTLAACDLRADCHAVFVDPGTCGCAGIGCCAKFSRCAAGDRADCRGPAACDALTPHCEGAYVVGYNGACYEGCVRATECAP